MNKISYQRLMEKQIAESCGQRVPRLLLHSCCGPCSTHCIQTLSEHFSVTVYYYNPNIYPKEEYGLRAREQERFVREFPTRHPVSFVEGPFESGRFYETVRGMEGLAEGGERCFACYELRLRSTAEYARGQRYDFFTTTLSISPLKNADKLNEIGERLAGAYGVAWLYADFKKKDGYKNSTELSKEYGMYRQNYCGCVFSLPEGAAAQPQAF